MGEHTHHRAGGGDPSYIIGKKTLLASGRALDADRSGADPMALLGLQG